MVENSASAVFIKINSKDNTLAVI